MFLLGVLSILQMLIIPGFIFLKVFRIKTSGILQFVLYSMGLSLYINYLLVCLLAWLKIYTAPVMYAFFTIEIVFLAVFRTDGSLIKALGKTISDYYLQIRNYLTHLSPFHRVAFISSGILILFFFSLIPVSTGTSCFFTDALVCWNRWTRIWISNTFPNDTSHYPQLFTTNLSLMGVFTGEKEISFFEKMASPMFSIGLLLMFFDLAVKKKTVVHLAGLIIYGTMLIIFYNLLFILDVNADIPVAFFSFLAFYTILLQEKEGLDIKTIVLVGIFVSCAADTKLAGVYIFCMGALWILHTFYKNRETVSIKEILRTALYLSIILAGSLFWYIIKPHDMAVGLDQSMFLPNGYWNRFVRAVDMLYFSAGPVFFLFLTVTTIAALFSKQARIPLFFIVIPASLFWIFFFSTDHRNLSFVIPFLAYTSAWGTQYLNNKLVVNKKQEITLSSSSMIRKNKILASAALFIFLAALIYLLSTPLLFNSGICLAYGLNRYYFGNSRIVSVTDMGYYRFIEYFTSSLRILCALIMFILAVKYLKIKTGYVVILIAAAAVFSNYTFLTKEKIDRMVQEDFKKVDVDNLYFRIHTYTKNSTQTSRIITNSTRFAQLVPIPGTEVSFVNNLNADRISKNFTGYKNSYLLLENHSFDNCIIDTLAVNNEAKKYKGYSLCFLENGYMLLKAAK